MLLPANEAVNLSKKNIYGGYTRFQVLPKVDLELSFIWEDIAGGSFWLSIQVDCDRTKLLIIVMTAPANFKDRCFTLVVLLWIQKILICEYWRILKFIKIISRQLIRMTWGSKFQLEMVKGTLVFVIGTFDDDNLQQKVVSTCYIWYLRVCI